jgi:hypothetical protein
MKVFTGLFQFVTLAIVGCALAAVLVAFWWNTRARNLDRLAMKRHVQEKDLRGSA